MRMARVIGHQVHPECSGIDRSEPDPHFSIDFQRASDRISQREKSDLDALSGG